MFYVHRGEIPHKRHTQFRKPDGSLYAEELFGVEGFAGRASLLYHHTRRPRRTRSKRSGTYRSISRTRTETDPTSTTW